MIVSKGLRSREMVVSYSALSPTVPPWSVLQNGGMAEMGLGRDQRYGVKTAKRPISSLYSFRERLNRAQWWDVIERCRVQRSTLIYTNSMSLDTIGTHAHCLYRGKNIALLCIDSYVNKGKEKHIVMGISCPVTVVVIGPLLLQLFYCGGVSPRCGVWW